MLTKTLSMFFVFLLGSQLCAQDEFPKQLIGFLKAGQYVGVSTGRDTRTLVLIFKNQTDMDIHRDSEEMSVDELRKKYPQVERQAIELLESKSANSNDLGSDSKPPKLEIARRAPMGYARVLHVGDDYVVFEYEDAHRIAYSSNQIERITWSSGKASLFLSKAGATFTGKP